MGYTFDDPNDDDVWAVERQSEDMQSLLFVPIPGNSDAAQSVGLYTQVVCFVQDSADTNEYPPVNTMGYELLLQNTGDRPSVVRVNAIKTTTPNGDFLALRDYNFEILTTSSDTVTVNTNDYDGLLIYVEQESLMGWVEETYLECVARDFVNEASIENKCSPIASSIPGVDSDASNPEFVYEPCEEVIKMSNIPIPEDLNSAASGDKAYVTCFEQMASEIVDNRAIGYPITSDKGFTIEVETDGSGAYTLTDFYWVVASGDYGTFVKDTSKLDTFDCDHIGLDGAYSSVLNVDTDTTKFALFEVCPVSGDIPLFQSNPTCWVQAFEPGALHYHDLRLYSNPEVSDSYVPRMTFPTQQRPRDPGLSCQQLVAEYFNSATLHQLLAVVGAVWMMA